RRSGRPTSSPGKRARPATSARSEEHTSELQSLTNLVCRLLLEKKKQPIRNSMFGEANESKAGLHAPQEPACAGGCSGCASHPPWPTDQRNTARRSDGTAGGCP